MKSWMILLVTALLMLGGCKDDNGANATQEAIAGPSAPAGEKAPPSPPVL